MTKYYEDSEEPTFSLHDFKKWLDKQGPEEVTENAEEFHKQESKEEFKERFKEKVKKKKKDK